MNKVVGKKGRMGRVVFIRHGESIWNVTDPSRNLTSRFTGWVDVPLTDKGLRQADAAGRCLKMFNIRFDAVYTSLLCRSIDTYERVPNPKPNPNPSPNPNPTATQIFIPPGTSGNGVPAGRPCGEFLAPQRAALRRAGRAEQR